MEKWLKCSPGKHVEEAEKRSLGSVEVSCQGLRIDIGGRNVHPDPVNCQKQQSRHYTALELGNSPYVRKAAKHLLFSFQLAPCYQRGALGGINSTLPPAASIFAIAEALALCTRTVTD